MICLKPRLDMKLSLQNVCRLDWGLAGNSWLFLRFPLFVATKVQLWNENSVHLNNNRQSDGLKIMSSLESRIVNCDSCHKNSEKWTHCSDVAFKLSCWRGRNEIGAYLCTQCEKHCISFPCLSFALLKLFHPKNKRKKSFRFFLLDIFVPSIFSSLSLKCHERVESSRIWK